jgi:hypothetical protein
MIAAALAALALAAPCHADNAVPFTLPDNRCTPGRFAVLTKAQACTPKDRPGLPVADRRRILTNYGIDPKAWTGASGELDHRQPVWSGGLTVVGNIWPERGGIPNAKDALENYTRRRVCTGKPHPMSLRTVHIIFAGSWLAYYRFYVLGVGPRPAS